MNCIPRPFKAENGTIGDWIRLQKLKIELYLFEWK
jgi:hypothetical protein